MPLSHQIIRSWVVVRAGLGFSGRLGTLVALRCAGSSHAPTEGQAGQPCSGGCNCVSTALLSLSSAFSWCLNGSWTPGCFFRREGDKGWSLFSSLSSSSGVIQAASGVISVTVSIKYFNVPNLKPNKLLSLQAAFLLLAIFTFIHVLWLRNPSRSQNRIKLLRLMLRWTEHLPVLFLSVGIGIWISPKQHFEQLSLLQLCWWEC